MINENIRHLIIGFGVLFWFRGMYRILDKFISDNMTNNIIIVVISLVIFFAMDGSLEKIGSRTQIPEPNKEKK